MLKEVHIGLFANSNQLLIMCRDNLHDLAYTRTE